MSFRLKLFGAIAIAVLITALVEGALDQAYDVWHDRIETRTREELQVFAGTAARALELEGATAALDTTELEAMQRLSGERLRLVQDGATVLTFGGVFPESSDGWAMTERYLRDGYRLDVALRLDPVERILGSDLLLDLLDLPLLFALAIGVAWAFTRIVMRPVRALTQGLRKVSEQEFPEPVPVPEGEDELSELGRSFNTMSASMQGLIERERAFTRYASHELRTPLSAQKVHTEALELGLTTAEEAVPVLGRNIQRMEDVLVALLALTRPDDVSSAPATLEQVVQEVVSALPPPGRERVTYLPRATEPLHVANANLVRQVIGNLVENGLKYSDGPVTLITESVGRTARVRVCDQGPGIPTDRLDRMRKPFARGDHPTPGLGLGLALAENAVASLRGSIDYRHRDEGFEVAISLPTLTAPSPPLNDAASG